MTRRTTDEHGGAWRRWREKDARAELAELVRTGETAASFAQRKGISVQRLRYWKKRLGACPTREPAAFVTVTLPSVPVSRPELEIRIGDLVVVVREGCDVEHVANVVEAVARRTRAC